MRTSFRGPAALFVLASLAFAAPVAAQTVNPADAVEAADTVRKDDAAAVARHVAVPPFALRALAEPLEVGPLEGSLALFAQKGEVDAHGSSPNKQ